MRHSPDALKMYLVVEVDGDAKPISLDKIDSNRKKGKSSARKFAIGLHFKNDYLINYYGERAHILKPSARFTKSIVERYGFEVIGVDGEAICSRTNKNSGEYTNWLVKRLAEQITRKKSV